MTPAPGAVALDRLIVSVEQRREVLIDVIRQARSRITLSLFRCNDKAVFDELGAAVKRGVIVEVLVTDTIGIPPERRIGKLKVLSIGELLAKAVRYTHSEQSVSSLFD